MIHRQHQARLAERLRLRQATAWAGGGCRKRILPIDFRTGPTGARHVQRRHRGDKIVAHRSEEHTSELQSLMRISYAVFCLKKKKKQKNKNKNDTNILASTINK